MNLNNPNDLQLFAVYISKLSPTELALLASAAGIILSQGLNGEQANSLGNFFETVGQVILAYGSQAQLLSSYRKKGL